METIKKCIISRYDKTITEPPFLTIPIDTLEIAQPTTDYLGIEFARRLDIACKNKGYAFKFYTMSKEENVDYEIVVY